jgi:type III pantothenate kinase
MNLIAVDIGNTNIRLGLFLKGEEKLVVSVPGGSVDVFERELKELWEKIPVSKASKEKKRDGVIIASSVKPAWTEMIRKIAEQLGEKIRLIGKDIPFPIDLSVDKTYKDKIGTDRVVTAAAAYVVVEDAVIVADFGTAVTIDMVDERGVFVGGVIVPGFEASAQALKNSTVHLPKIKVSRPAGVYGTNTEEAINCGLYYSAIATLQEIIRRFAETIGRWPQTIITGAGAELIKDDCKFIDNYVPNLVIKGIALAYRKHIESKV